MTDNVTLSEFKRTLEEYTGPGMTRIVLKHADHGLITVYDSWDVPNIGEDVIHEGVRFRVIRTVHYTTLPDDKDVIVVDV